MYNPWTGETIVDNDGVVDRSISMWAPAEENPAKNVQVGGILLVLQITGRKTLTIGFILSRTIRWIV
jgi:hypothetical protein